MDITRRVLRGRETCLANLTDVKVSEDSESLKKDHYNIKVTPNCFCESLNAKPFDINMFKRKTAWFSDSVEKGVINFWVSEGGDISSWKTAGYLFSDNASSEDTKRIYGSEDYVKNRATVFHSSFLSACQPRQSVTSVPIGHYVLPPDSVQNEMRAIIGRFIWEKDEQEMCEEQMNPEVSKDILSGETEDHPVRERCSQDDYQTVASQNKVCSCCEMRQYPVNNMISGYVHIDQMKKYSGELEDFLPSLHGHDVSRSNDLTPPFYRKAV